MKGEYFNNNVLVIYNDTDNIMGVFYRKYNKIIFRTIREGNPIEIRLEHTSKINEFKPIENWNPLQKFPAPNITQKINCIKYKQIGEVVEKLFKVLWSDR